MPDTKWEPRDRPNGKDPEVWEKTATNIRDWGVELWHWGRGVRRDILVLEETVNLLIEKGLISKQEVEDIQRNVDAFLASEQAPPKPDTGRPPAGGTRGFGLGPGRGDPDDPPPPPWKGR